MNDPASFLPVSEADHPARSAATSDTAVTGVGWPVVYVARDVMTRDPDRVECGDTLVEVARRMRNLKVAFLPVCGERGDLQGVIALRDLLRAATPRGSPRPRSHSNRRSRSEWMIPSVTSSRT